MGAKFFCHHLQFSCSWSFGVLLHEIFTGGEQPYPGMSVKQVAESLTREERMQKHPFVPSTVYGTMMHCWAEAPEDRPTFTALVNIFEELSEREDDVSSYIQFLYLMYI